MTDKKGAVYQGSETLVTEFKMVVQAYLVAILTAFILQVLVFGLILYLKGMIQPVVQNTAGYLITWLAKDYYPHKLINFCSLAGECARFTLEKAYPLFLQNLSLLWDYGIKQALAGSFLSYFVSLPLVFKVFHAKAEKLNKEKVLRGADIMPESKVAKTLPKPWRLPISKRLAIPIAYETQHILIAGKTGVGKTTLISQMLERLRRDGVEKVIVYDYKGDYISKFYRPKVDYIFNPFNPNCVRWTVFNDIQSPTDIISMSESLIGEVKGKDSDYWESGSIALTRAVLDIARKENPSNAYVWRLLSLGKTKLLEKLYSHLGKESESAAIIASYFADRDAQNQTAGILSTVLQKAQIFENLAKLDGPFSFTEWLYSNSPGWLFIQNDPMAKKQLVPALSMVIDLLIRRILKLPDDKNRRVFLFIDEFATLQPLPSLVDFLTLARSKGGVMVLGIQDLGRVQKLYGREETKTIVNNTANHIIFSVVGETAEEFSRLIGEKEVTIANQSYNYGPVNIRDGVSTSIHEQKKLVLLPSELASLKKFEVVVRFAEGQLTKTKIRKHFIEPAKEIELKPITPLPPPTTPELPPIPEEPKEKISVIENEEKEVKDVESNFDGEKKESKDYDII